MQQKFRILNNLDDEYIQFLRDEIKELGSEFRNLKPLEGKRLKQLNTYGKNLIKIYKIWTKLKQLDLLKKEHEDIQEILFITSQTKEYQAHKQKPVWKKHHDQQLKLLDQYVDLKKKLQNMNDGYA